MKPFDISLDMWFVGRGNWKSGFSFPDIDTIVVGYIEEKDGGFRDFEDVFDLYGIVVDLYRIAVDLYNIVVYLYSIVVDLCNIAAG